MDDQNIESNQSATPPPSHPPWYINFLPALVTGLVLGFAIVIFTKSR